MCVYEVKQEFCGFSSSLKMFKRFWIYLYLVCFIYFLTDKFPTMRVKICKNVIEPCQRSPSFTEIRGGVLIWKNTEHQKNTENQRSEWRDALIQLLQVLLTFLK